MKNNKQEKRLKIYRIISAVLYVILGILVIIFRDMWVDYLHYVVGAPTLILALHSLYIDLLTKSYKDMHNRIGYDIARIAISCIIIFVYKDSMYIACVLWGMLAIFNASFLLSKAFYLMHKKSYFLFSLILSVSEITFAILLIIDPMEHVMFHIILLGVEFILDAIRNVLLIVHMRLPIGEEELEE